MNYIALAISNLFLVNTPQKCSGKYAFLLQDTQDHMDTSQSWIKGLLDKA